MLHFLPVSPDESHDSDEKKDKGKHVTSECSQTHVTVGSRFNNILERNGTL